MLHKSVARCTELICSCGRLLPVSQLTRLHRGACGSSIALAHSWQPNFSDTAGAGGVLNSSSLRPRALAAVTSEGLHITNNLPEHTSVSGVAPYGSLLTSGTGSDTVVAIVTGAQQGAVSIVRLSGGQAVQIAQQVFRLGGRSRPWEPQSHRVYYGNVVDEAGSVVDEVLALVMLGPRSYTAEDVVELHAHGGGVCGSRVLRCCLGAGARLARPGEFTLRAFLNGRLDLAQAENVGRLVAARTPAAADSALAGLAGGLGEVVRRVRGRALALLAELEARLDFEEDLPPLHLTRLQETVAGVVAEVRAARGTARAGQLLAGGLQVALVGRPNVGKSSLLNACSGSQRAIVTPIPGTTRDIVEAGVSIGGVPVVLLDTAGMRESGDLVEQLGVERSVAAATAADIVILVLDAQAGWGEEEEAILQQVRPLGSSSAVAAPLLLVVNKVDLATGGWRDLIPEQQLAAFSGTVATSAVTGEGLPDLQAALLRLAGAPNLASGGMSWAVNERQAEALLRAEEAFQRLTESVKVDLPIDFWTIDLRAAVMALGEISGEDVTEEILDNVFSRFCIGK